MGFFDDLSKAFKGVSVVKITADRPPGGGKKGKNNIMLFTWEICNRDN